MDQKTDPSNPYGGGQVYSYDQQPAPQNPSEQTQGAPPPYASPDGVKPYMQNQQPPQQYQPPPQQYPPGAYPQPQGGQQMVTNNTVVVASQPQAQNIVVCNYIRPNSNLTLAVLVCIFCNWPLGIVAIIFSVMSSSDADNNDMEGARQKGRISMWISLAAVLVTIIGIAIVVAVIVSNAKKMDTINYNY